MNGAEGGQPAENRGLPPVHAVSCPRGQRFARARGVFLKPDAFVS